MYVLIIARQGTEKADSLLGKESLPAEKEGESSLLRQGWEKMYALFTL